MKPTSAGFLIRSKQLYLLCHITQDPEYIYNDDDSFWSIPKGIVNDGEDPFQAALREVKEETSINLEIHKNIQIDETPFHTHSTLNKHYIIFLADDLSGILLRHKLKCTSLINNEKCPLRNGLPEHDMFKWTSKEEARRLTFPSLKHIFLMHYV